MRFESRYKEGSVFFAPMEGVTDANYRKIILENFPEWDGLWTDFLRLPNSGHFKDSKLNQHFGLDHKKKEGWLNKTAFQILSNDLENIPYHTRRINDLGYSHFDLNLGCPSKSVNQHCGGAYLLKNLDRLEAMVMSIRTHFDGIFTAKIRVGYEDDSKFEDILKILEIQGVDAITIHCRTKEQLYKGRANWDYLKRAVKLVSVPIIGNGDIWQPLDIETMIDSTGVNGVMCARGALKTPWLATLYRNHQDNLYFISDEYLNHERKNWANHYFQSLKKVCLNSTWAEGNLLNRFKSLAHFLFEGDQMAQDCRQRLFRTQELSHFMDILEEYKVS
jgi:tRNA-dihydrouridine synthase